MQTTIPRPTLLPLPVETFSIRPNMFDKTESTWVGNGDFSHIKGSYVAKLPLRYDLETSLEVPLELKEPSSRLARRYFRAIAEKVCEQNPGIDINEEIKGTPTIKGNRISVGQVLGRVYVLGSVDAVVEYYRSSISKEQVKEALAFAQDFLEAACEPI